MHVPRLSQQMCTCWRDHRDSHQTRAKMMDGTPTHPTGFHLQLSLLIYCSPILFTSLFQIMHLEKESSTMRGFTSLVQSIPHFKPSHLKRDGALEKERNFENIQGCSLTPTHSHKCQITGPAQDILATEANHKMEGPTTAREEGVSEHLHWVMLSL